MTTPETTPSPNEPAPRNESASPDESVAKNVGRCLRKKAAAHLVEPASVPNNIFWDNVLKIRDTDERRYNLFSFGFKYSAEIYSQQLSRWQARMAAAA